MDTLHYDPGMSGMLKGNSNHVIVLNNRFSSWEDHIEFCLANRDIEDLVRFESEERSVRIETVDIMRYRIHPYNDLFKAAIRLAAEHNKPLKKDKILLLVHPFYMFFSHMNVLRTYDRRKAAQEYKEGLMASLQIKGLDKVIMDTAHHYAAGTSLLLEQGVVDRVLFTEFDKGSLLNLPDLMKFYGKTVYVGGGYNNRCLYGALKYIIHIAGEIKVVEDLVLNCPLDTKDIRKIKRIAFAPGKGKKRLAMPKDQIVKLKEVA